MKADAKITDKTIKLGRGKKKSDQSFTVCQAHKKAAKQILSQNHKNIV